MLQIPFPQLSSGLTCELTEVSPPIPSLHFSHLPLQICLVEKPVLGAGRQGVYKALRELVLSGTAEFILIQLSLLVLSYKFSL